MFTSTVRTMYICAEEDISQIQYLALKTQNESRVRKIHHMFVPYVTFFPPDGTCLALAVPSSPVLSLVPFAFCSLSLALILVGYLQESQVWCWLLILNSVLDRDCCRDCWFSKESMLFGPVFVETPCTSIVCNA
jgi:hypothetical protein